MQKALKAFGDIQTIGACAMIKSNDNLIKKINEILLDFSMLYDHVANIQRNLIELGYDSGQRNFNKPEDWSFILRQFSEIEQKIKMLVSENDIPNEIKTYIENVFNTDDWSVCDGN